MNCKHCKAELPAGVTVCPECGHENAAEAKAGLSGGRIALLVILVVVAIAVVVALIVGGTSGEPAETTGPSDAQATTDASVPQESTAPTSPADTGADDVTCKGSYTAAEDEVLAAGDAVVATLGDAVLTNADLQVYYWMQVYDFLSNYGSYASLLGMDYTQGLDTQLSLEGNITWQQYFLDSALSTWQNYEALRQAANAAGYELDASYAEYLQKLPQMMEDSASSYGYETALEMVQADMGPGATMEAYMHYMECYYVGYLYYSDTLAAIEISDEEVEAYFDANAESYLANGLEKTDETCVDVRHILISIVDADEDGTYSEEEWQTCMKSAEDILHQWLEGDKTEEAFAELANTYSEDPGSKTYGGLYTEVEKGQMVEAFDEWCFDESRKYGDYGIVQTEFGCHIMYFVNSEKVWYMTAWNDLMTEKGNELLENALSANTLEVDYSAIVLGEVSLVSAS